MNIDIKELENIKEELYASEDNGDVLFIDEDGKSRFALLPIDLYDAVEDIVEMLNNANGATVKIATPENIDLSYDEYERIKEQIMDAVDRVFMPKPEKLN